MKKLVCILLSVVIFCSVLTGFGVSASGAEKYPLGTTFVSKKFHCESKGNGEIMITYYEGGAKNLKIPSEINGYKVVELGSIAREHPQLKSVTIPDTVTEIGTYAFKDCEKLATIEIPDSVTRIGNNAFHGTKWYESQPDGIVMAGKVLYDYKGKCPVEVVVPEGTIGIADSAFSNDKFLENISLNDEIKCIGSSAFSNCKSLGDIQLPKGLLEIYSSAFSSCKALESISIPNSVTYIEWSAFSNCTGLKSVKLPKKLKEIQSNLFYNCKNLIEITIPKKVTDIAPEAFYGCRKLKKVSFPKKLVTVGENAFEKTAWYQSQPQGIVYAGKAAYKLKGTCPSKAVLKKGTRSITAELFYNKSNLKEVVLPNTVRVIGKCAFGGCKNLKSVKLSKKLTLICGSVFENCTSLTEVVMYNKLTDIYASAFCGCTNLKKAVIPASVKFIGFGVFWNCPNLTIYGKSGSYAITYAKDNNIPYKYY